MEVEAARRAAVSGIDGELPLELCGVLPAGKLAYADQRECLVEFEHVAGEEVAQLVRPRRAQTCAGGQRLIKCLAGTKCRPWKAPGVRPLSQSRDAPPLEVVSQVLPVHLL